MTFTLSHHPMALPGFAAGIDWGATMILLAIAGLVLIAIGAIGAFLLAPYIQFVDPKSRSGAPAPQAPAAYPQVPPVQPPVPTASTQAPAEPQPRSAQRPPGPPEPRPSAATVAPEPLAPVGPAGAVTVSVQRAALIDGVVKVCGLLDDDIAADVLNDAMRRGGVTTFEATGMRVDPKRHRVERTIPAPRPENDGIVAETLAPGYFDNGRVLRPADVVVYQWVRR